MSAAPAVKAILRHYKTNELIFAGRFYREEAAAYMKEAAFYKMLERMCKSGELAKAAKGVYYIPHITKYGVVPPSEREIVEAFTKNATGIVIGYAMYNRFHLTTQVPKTIQVLSSVPEGASKTVRNVTVRQVPLKYSEEVKNMIRSLEVLQNFYEIQDINYTAFLTFTREMASSYQEEIFEEVTAKITYKKSTISFLKEILGYYQVPNHLQQYLSQLSRYKHPRMEELYEASQRSGRI